MSKLYFYLVEHSSKKLFICDSFGELSFMINLISHRPSCNYQVILSNDIDKYKKYKVVNISERITRFYIAADDHINKDLIVYNIARSISMSFVQSDDYIKLKQLFIKNLNEKISRSGIPKFISILILSVWIQTINEYNDTYLYVA